MSHQVNQLRQCNYCSALFETDALLQAHLQYFRSRSLELEECRAHAQANENAHDEAYDSDAENMTISPNTKCPFEDCQRSQPFKTGQQLRVHFRTHIACLESCPCCFKHIQRTSEFIRHTREHPDAIEIKRKYMEELATWLRRKANKELSKQLRSLRKRNPEVADLDETSNFKLRRVEESVPMTTIPSRYLVAPDIQQTSSIQPHSTTTASKLGLHHETGMVHTNVPDDSIGFQAKELSHMLNDHIWDPPLFTRINFPQYSTDPLIPASSEGLQ